MYKFMAIDLDGTLLNSYGEVSQANQEAIQKAIEKGIQVVLTSGRISTAIEYIADQIGGGHYFIAGNGTSIYDLQEKKEIFNRCMTKEKVLEIIRICEENSIYYSVFGENSIIAKSLEYNVLVYNSENAKKAPESKTKINLVEDVYSYIKNSNQQKFPKVTICDMDQVIFRGIMQKIRQLDDIDVLEVAHMSRKQIKRGTENISLQYFYTDITKKSVNKWNAIQYLIQKLNIQPEEVMAIGDNANDIEMIRSAGLGVAMGNASPQVKEIADLVVRNNDENGVADAIEKAIM